MWKQSRLRRVASVQPVPTTGPIARVQRIVTTVHDPAYSDNTNSMQERRMDWSGVSSLLERNESACA